MIERTRDIINGKINLALVGLVIVVACMPFEMILSSIGTGLYAFFTVFNVFRSIGSPDRGLIKGKIVILVPLVYFLVVVIGLVYSGSINEDFSIISKRLSLFVLPILIMFSKLKLSDINLVKKVFIYSCIAFCCFSIGTLFFNLFVHFDHKHHYNFVQRSMYHFHFPYDSLYINFAYALLIFGNYKKLFKRIVSVLFLIVILLFGVRIGLFSFLLISLIYIGVHFKTVFKLKNFVFLIIVLVACFTLLKTTKYGRDKYYDTLNKIGFNTKNQVSKIGSEYHKIGERQIIWNASMELIGKKPFFGYGTSIHQDKLNALYMERNCKTCINKNSHNQYLSTLLNYGVFGLFVLVFILVFCIIKGFEIKSADFLLFLLLISTLFFTETVLHRQKGIMFFSVFVSLFLNEYVIKKQLKIKKLNKNLLSDKATD